MKTPSQDIARPPDQEQKYTLLQYIVVVVILFILPFLVPEYFRSLLSKIYIFAIFAMGLNLVLGYTGLISLGHAAYLGVGGYTVGILMTHLGIESLGLLFLSAIIMSAIVAAMIGFVALRVTGMHFILITIAFGQLLFAIAVKWRSVTGSTDGLIGIFYPAVDFIRYQWTGFSFHYLILLVFIVCYILMYLITNSSFGYALIGIRENEPRMQGLGYNTWLYKYVAFILGGIFSGVAGALFAPFYGIMVPNHFGLLTSSMAVLMVLLGSPGTLYGPVIGAFVILSLEFFASIYSPERWPLILGATFIVCITVFRGGIGIYLAGGWEKLRGLLWRS